MTKIQLTLKTFDFGMENKYKENKRNTDGTRNMCLKIEDAQSKTYRSESEPHSNVKYCFS